MRQKPSRRSTAADLRRIFKAASKVFGETTDFGKWCAANAQCRTARKYRGKVSK